MVRILKILGKKLTLIQNKVDLHLRSTSKRIKCLSTSQQQWKVLDAVHWLDTVVFQHIELITVANPGFSRGGYANSQKSYYFSFFFCWKLHENERIWTGGGASPLRNIVRWIPKYPDESIRSFTVIFALYSSERRIDHLHHQRMVDHLLQISPGSSIQFQHQFEMLRTVHILCHFSPFCEIFW